MILADTDVLIDALRGRDPSRSRVEAEVRREALATTTVTEFELTSGARTEEHAQSIDDLLAPLQILAFDSRAARAAAELRRELEGSGKTIGMGDYLIAGIAVSGSLPLLTRNRKHFDRVPGLRVLDL